MSVYKKLKITQDQEQEQYYGIKISNIGYSISDYSSLDGNRKGDGGIDFHCVIKSIEGNTIQKQIYLYVACLNNKQEIIATSDPLRLDPEEFRFDFLWTTGMCLNHRGLKELKVFISYSR